MNITRTLEKALPAILANESWSLRLSLFDRVDEAARALPKGERHAFVRTQQQLLDATSEARVLKSTLREFATSRVRRSLAYDAASSLRRSLQHIVHAPESRLAPDIKRDLTIVIDQVRDGERLMISGAGVLTRDAATQRIISNGAAAERHFSAVHELLLDIAPRSTRIERGHSFLPKI